MAAIFWRGLGCSRLTRITTVTRPSIRGILDYPSLRPDSSSLLDTPLHQSDLPPIEEDYFKVVDREYFRKKYGNAKRIYIYSPIPEIDPKTEERIPKKYAAVVPLTVRNLGVIPVPVILDCGAPGSLYLGSKPLEILMNMNLVQELTTTDHPYVIKNAILSHGEWELEPVFMCPVPRPHESQDTGSFGNICCNILGARALWHLPNLLKLREDFGA